MHSIRLARLPHVFLPVFFALVCPFAGSAQSAPTEPESILGTYYYKGIALLEVRQEGDRVVTELAWEKNAFDFPIARPTDSNQTPEEKQTAEKLGKYRHHGRLAAPNRIEFDDTDATFENLLKRFGLAESDLNDSPLAASKQSFPAGGYGHYYERWELLPGGSLRVECAFPIVNLAGLAPAEVDKCLTFTQSLGGAAEHPPAGDTVGIATTPAHGGAGFLDRYKAEHPADLTRVCAWKIDSDGERAAWKSLDDGKYAEAAAAFHAAALAQPGRPFACLGEAWARVGTKEFGLARQALQAGRDRMSDETRPWLSSFAVFLADQIDSYETAAAGPAVDFSLIAASLDEKSKAAPKTDLSALSRKKAREWDANDYQLATQSAASFPWAAEIQNSWQMRGRAPLYPIGQEALNMKTRSAMPVPNFLVFQNTARYFVFCGHAWRMQRDYAKATYQYGLSVRMGQMMRHGTLISHLIGVAVENIGCGGLSQMVEDGLVADPATLQSISQVVASLNQGEAALEPDAMFVYEFGQVPYSSDPVLDMIFSTIAVPNFLESRTRATVVPARLALLSGACAVKTAALKPPYPATLGAAALPKDPFAPDATLRYRASGAEAVLYSVGPDKKDDGGAIDYDPTNGTRSAGDIVLTIR